MLPVEGRPPTCVDQYVTYTTLFGKYRLLEEHLNLECDVSFRGSATLRHGGKGAPEALLVFEPDVLDALRELRPGTEVFLLTWLDRARRDVLRVHPRGDHTRPMEGVFSTRSPHRPNPIGLHLVEITAVDGLRVRVRSLEAVNGTPIVDLKPVLANEIRDR